MREVLTKPDLRKAIERTNLSNCEPWLEEARISQALTAPEVAEVQKPRVMHCGVVENLLSRRVQVRLIPTEIAA
jgi:hypothetical protein